MNIPAHEIILQQPPFVFVTQLTHYDEQTTQTSFLVPDDGVFCHDGHLTVGGLVENIAQSNAARIGYKSKYILHEAVSVGYIGAVRSLRVHCLPRVGETLTTRLTLLSEAFGMSAIQATVVGSESGLCAEGEMKTALAR